MIGVALILMGCVSLYLAFSLLKDYRRRENGFAPSDDLELNYWWQLTTKVRRFHSHLDLWIFGVLGPVLIVVGLIAVFD